MPIDTRYKVVTGEVESAGVMCWWELHGSVDLDAAREALYNAKLDPDKWGPRPPSLEQCLTVAVRQHCGERRKSGVIAVRRAGAWYLIEATVSKATEDLDVNAFARLRLTEVDGRTLLARKVLRPGREAFVAEVAASFKTMVEEAVVHETSAWFSRVHQRVLDGTRLRDNGGIYFVPSPRRPEWAVFWDAIKAAGGRHVVYGVDAMPTEDTVRAVLDAVTRDAERVIAEVAPKFDSPEGLTERGARAVEDKLADALARLERYDGILGDRLEALRDRLGNTRGLIGVTRMRAMQAAMGDDE